MYAIPYKKEHRPSYQIHHLDHAHLFYQQELEFLKLFCYPTFVTIFMTYFELKVLDCWECKRVAYFFVQFSLKVIVTELKKIRPESKIV